MFNRKIEKIYYSIIRKPVEEALHKCFMSLFRDYLISGGLPDAISQATNVPSEEVKWILGL